MKGLYCVSGYISSVSGHMQGRTTAFESQMFDTFDEALGHLLVMKMTYGGCLHAHVWDRVTAEYLEVTGDYTTYLKYKHPATMSKILANREARLLQSKTDGEIT